MHTNRKYSLKESLGTSGSNIKLDEICISNIDGLKKFYRELRTYVVVVYQCFISNVMYNGVIDKTYEIRRMFQKSLMKGKKYEACSSFSNNFRSFP